MIRTASYVVAAACCVCAYLGPVDDLPGASSVALLSIQTRSPALSWPLASSSSCCCGCNGGAVVIGREGVRGMSTCI